MADFGALTVRFMANIQDLSSKLALASGQMKSFADKNSVALGSIGTALTGIGIAITGALGLAVKQSMDFERAITNSASVTGLAGEEFDKAREKMSALARELGANTVFSATQASEAMYDLASKGFEPAKMSVAELQPYLDLASATQADLKLSTETVTATIRAFALQTTDASRVADVFTKAIGSSALTIDKISIAMNYVAPIAHTAGLGLEEMTSAIAKVADLGIPASMAGTALRMTIATLITPSEKLNEILDTLGLTMGDVDFRTKGFAGVLKTLDEAGVSAGQVMELFGARAGGTVNALLGVDSAGKKVYETITQLDDTLQKAGGTARTVAELQLQNLWGAIEYAKSAFEELQITVGDVLLPTLTEFFQNVKTGIDALNRFAQAHPDLIENIVMLTAKLGLLSLALGGMTLAFSPLITLVTSVGKAIYGMASQTKIATEALATWGAKTGEQKLLLSLSAGVITGIYIVAIVALIATIKEVLALYNDWQTAIEITKKKQEDALKATAFAYKNVSDQLKTLEGTYSDLTNSEIEQIRVIQEEIKAQEERNKLLQQAGKFDDEAKEASDRVIIALKERATLLEKQITATERMTYAQELLNMQDKYSEQALERQKKALAPLIDEYVRLTDQFNKNEIGATTYLEAFDRISKAMLDAGMSVDEVAKKLAELDQKQFKVEVDLEITGEEDLRNAERDIARLQGEYALLVTKDEDARNRLQRTLALKEDLADIEDRRISLEEAYQEIDKKGIELQKEKIEAIKQQYQDENILKTEQGRKELERINKEVETFKQKERDKVEVLKTSLSQQEDLLKAIYLKNEEAVASLSDTVSEANEKEMEEIREKTGLLETLKSKYSEVGMSAQGFTVPTIDFKSGLQGVTSGLSGVSEGLRGLSVVSEEVNTKIEEVFKDTTNTVNRALETLVSGSGGGGSRFSGDYSGLRTLRSGQGGIPFVPRTGSYRLHKGETVLPQDKATAGEITIVNVIDEKMIPQIMAKYPNAIINPMLNSMQTNPVVKKVMRNTLK